MIKPGQKLKRTFVINFLYFLFIIFDFRIKFYYTQYRRNFLLVILIIFIIPQIFWFNSIKFNSKNYEKNLSELNSVTHVYDYKPR